MAAESNILPFTPFEILIRGFRYIKGLPNIEEKDWSQCNIEKFMNQYGQHPIEIAVMWNDILTLDIDLGLCNKDKSEEGFQKLMRAVHFLWAYPKNAGILAATFGTCKRLAEGEYLWKWVRVIANLKAIKFVWPEEEYNDPSGKIFIVTVDGVDFKVWEKKHNTYPIDRGQYSHKVNHGALKYEIAIDTVKSQVVWINGPHRGGEHDKTIYSMALRDMVPAGKKIIADRVYGSKKASNPNDREKIALPNTCDSPELNNFKARLRARHETFNGRIRMFRVLSDTFHHANGKHGFVFDAVCVMVQYQMDYGRPLFRA